MKLIKTTTKKIHTKEYGWIEQKKFYLFGLKGLHFLTENNPVPPMTEPVEALEHRAAKSLQAEAHRSINDCELPHLSNENFDKFQREIREQL